jgi:hypothetical protein
MTLSFYSSIGTPSMSQINEYFGMNIILVSRLEI